MPVAVIVSVNATIAHSAGEVIAVAGAALSIVKEASLLSSDVFPAASVAVILTNTLPLFIAGNVHAYVPSFTSLAAISVHVPHVVAPYAKVIGVPHRLVSVISQSVQVIL